MKEKGGGMGLSGVHGRFGGHVETRERDGGVWPSLRITPFVVYL